MAYGSGTAKALRLAGVTSVVGASVLGVLLTRQPVALGVCVVVLGGVLTTQRPRARHTVTLVQKDGVRYRATRGRRRTRQRHHR